MFRSSSFLIVVTFWDYNFYFFQILFISFYLFIYLFFGCIGSFLLRVGFSCGEWGLLFIVVCGLLIVVASLVAEHRLQACGLQQLWHVGSVVVARRLQSAGSVVVAHGAQLFCSMWDLPRPGLEPASPALAGGFLTTAPPGKPSGTIILNAAFQHLTLI